MDNIIELQPWEVHKFSWGTAVKHANGKWDKAFLYPNGQEIELSHLNVILHDNGIEFLEGLK
jgi:hypothetical protein